MSYAKFADALKATKDVLTKPYPDAHKVEFKATAVNGPVFTVEALLGEAPAAGKGKLATAALVFKGEGNVVGDFKLDKAQADTNGEVVAEFSLNKAVKDAKFSFKARDGTRVKATEGYEPVAASFGVEHKSQHATVTADVDAIKQTLSFSLLGGGKGAFAGVAGVIGQNKETKAVAPTDYSAVLGYKVGSVTLALLGEKRFSSLTVGYHQVVNTEFTVGATAKLPPTATGKDTIEITAGLTYKADADTVLAAKFFADGKEKRTLDLSYARQLSSLAKITVGAQLDAANIAKADHKLAVSLSLSA